MPTANRLLAFTSAVTFACGLGGLARQAFADPPTDPCYCYQTYDNCMVDCQGLEPCTSSCQTKYDDCEEYCGAHPATTDVERSILRGE